MKNYISAPPGNYDINEASLNLGFKVKGNALHRKEGGKAVIEMKGNDLLK
jgi:hypothetical protein